MTRSDNPFRRLADYTADISDPWHEADDLNEDEIATGYFRFTEGVAHDETHADVPVDVPELIGIEIDDGCPAHYGRERAIDLLGIEVVERIETAAYFDVNP